jgi:hypothetical protein
MTGKGKKLYQMMFKRLIFSQILEISLSAYIEFLIAGVLNSKYGFENKELFSEKLGYFLSIICLVIALFFVPFCLIRMLRMEIEEIKSKEF